MPDTQNLYSRSERLFEEKYQTTESQDREKLPVNKSTQALNYLKHTQEYIDKMKRRLSYLQIKQDQNRRQAIINEKKMEFHSKVQQGIEYDKKVQNKYLLKLEKQLQNSQAKIKSNKMEHNKNIFSIQEEICYRKKQQYQQIKQKSTQIDIEIKKYREQDLLEKVQHKKKINQMEKKQKQKVAKYFQQKKKEYKESSKREESSFKTKRTEKELILADLVAIENQMILRHSKSKSVLDSTKKRLEKVKGGIQKHGSETTEGLSEKLYSRARPNPEI